MVNELANYKALETYAYCLRDSNWLLQAIDNTICLFIEIRHRHVMLWFARKDMVVSTLAGHVKIVARIDMPCDASFPF